MRWDEESRSFPRRWSGEHPGARQSAGASWFEGTTGRAKMLGGVSHSTSQPPHCRTGVRFADDSEFRTPKEWLLMANILIVDDERCMRITLRAFLRGAGHDAVVAEDARQAIQLFEGPSPFDLVVSDIGLPYMSGFELCARLRKIAPDVKIILMTGDPSDQSAAKARQVGADRFLVKPVSEEAIRRAVAEVIGTMSPTEEDPDRMGRGDAR